MPDLGSDFQVQLYTRTTKVQLPRGTRTRRVAPTPRDHVGYGAPSGRWGQMGLAVPPERAASATCSVTLPAAHESHESNFFPHPDFLRVSLGG